MKYVVMAICLLFGSMPDARAADARHEWKSVTDFPIPGNKVGCTTRLYFLSTDFFQRLPPTVKVLDRARGIYDLAPWFHATGVTLAKGEFAYAHKSTGKIVVMTTSKNQDLVSCLWDN